jgi:hypothetical protein
MIRSLGEGTEYIKRHSEWDGCVNDMWKNLCYSTDHRQFIIDQIIITFF